MADTRKEFSRADGVTLKDHFDDKIKALNEKVELQFQLNKEAGARYDTLLDAKLASLNHIKELQKEQAATFLPRIEYELGHKILENDIHGLEISRAVLAGKADSSDLYRTRIAMYIGMFFGFAGFVFGLINILLK